LVGVEQRAGELGGLSEKNQQQARGERIEGSGMAGLPRAVEPLHLLQRRVGAHPERLVEQQSAVHLLFGPDAVDELRQAIGARDQIADFLRAPLASLHSDLATSCTSNTSSWSPSLMSEKFFSDRPHSKPALTSRASSLKRLSESMSPVWMTTLSRSTRTCALR